MNKKTRARELDQFYTNPEYAREFLAAVELHTDLSRADIVLEPSAGSGSFYNLLDPQRRVGLDLDPRAPGVIQQNFFEYQPPENKRIITIGNPPFGKNSNLAVKFFNRAGEFSDIIAFIIPRTFRKASIINRLHKNFHLIYDELTPQNSFLFNGEKYDVPCVAQIWERRDVIRERIKTIKINQLRDWFIPTDPVTSDFAVQRVGGRAGLIRIQDKADYSKTSHYFFKAQHPDTLNIFRSINFDSVKFNTAGNPSVSPSELCELFVKQAQVAGLKIELKEIEK